MSIRGSSFNRIHSYIRLTLLSSLRIFLSTLVPKPLLDFVFFNYFFLRLGPATSDQMRRPPPLVLCKTPPGPCYATRKAPAGGGKDALRTERAELSVGLHHSCRLHWGGCNPIPLGRATAQPGKRKRREGEREDSAVRALTRSPPLLPFPAECHPPSPIICSLPARLGC